MKAKIKMLLTAIATALVVVLIYAVFLPLHLVMTVLGVREFADMLKGISADIANNNTISQK